LKIALLVVVSAPAWAQSFDLPSTDATPPAASSSDRDPITAAGRFKWVANSTVGPVEMLTIPLESALQTWSNSPIEYGPHWDGWGRRMGSKFATAAVSSTMEASIGALWGEDPRYHRLGEGSAKSRLGHAVKMAFLAERTSGGVAPAYARFIAIPGSRLISNSWREPSEVTPGGTAWRIGLGFVRRIAGDTFAEYWPDMKRHFFHGNSGALISAPNAQPSPSNH